MLIPGVVAMTPDPVVGVFKLVLACPLLVWVFNLLRVLSVDEVNLNCGCSSPKSLLLGCLSILPPLGGLTPPAEGVCIPHCCGVLTISKLVTPSELATTSELVTPSELEKCYFVGYDTKSK